MKTRFMRGCSVLLLFLAFCSRSQAQLTILQQPLSLLDQVLGDTVSFCVTAQSQSSTNLQYQWLRNGVIIPGATNSCLPINNLQAINCGAFSVLVSDGVGVAVSEPADLTVTGLDLLEGIDQLLDALDLINTNGVIRSYNTNAVKQPGAPDIIPGDPGGAEIWFQWTVPLLQSSGIVTFSTLGSDFDTTMGAYTGSEPGDLVPVATAINDDDTAGYLNSQVSFYAEKGTTYLIAIDGFHGAQGNVVLSWFLNPNSDKLPNATNVPQTIVSSNGAAITLNSPWPGNKCDWLFNGNVIASNTSILTLTNLNQTNVGSYVGRFTTSDGISVSAEPTEVQINTLQDGSTAANSAAFVKFLDSANSAFDQPIPGKSGVMKLDGGGDSDGFSCSQTFNTTGNPDEAGEPVVCSQKGGHPGWYAYVAPSSGTMLVNTAGSTFNTILGVFVGPGNSFSTLTNVGCGYTTNYHTDGQPYVTVPSIPAGQTNYIMVEGEEAASGTVQLNINFGIPVTILSPPQSQSAGPGTNVSLTVSVSGNGPLNYAWQFNGTNIAEATNATLAIGKMQPSAAGAYTVIVSNSVSATSAQATLSYVVPATISSPLESQSAGPGTNVNFSVSASGTGPIGYAWQFNSTNIAGATNATLAIGNMQSFNAGTYTVVVSNSASVVSAQAVLSYIAPAAILSPPQSQSAGPGTNVSLGVSVSGTGPISYAWQFNSTNIPGATNGTLMIANMQSSNAGDYTVFVSNSISVASAQAVLSYIAPVIIQSAPRSQSAGPGTNVNLAVSVSGTGPIGYAWQFNGANLPGATNATFTIRNMQSSNAGTYTVIVSNSISSAIAQAVVSYIPPKPSNQPGSMTANANNSIVSSVNNPAMISSIAVNNGTFSMQISGAIGTNYVIEGSSDLINWVPLYTNTTPTDTLIFTDRNAGALTSRFYRGITNSPPESVVPAQKQVRN